MTRRACHAVRVIRSWKNPASRRFAESGKGKWSGLDQQRARLRLSQLDAAKTLEDLGQLRSVGLHKLSGGRSGQWAITINGPWRLVFRFAAGHAHDVEIVDDH
jgi:toxin HigB-1